jgi:hypothetical protein
MWLAIPSISGNFTFFFCLSWLFLYLKKAYKPRRWPDGIRRALFVAGALLGNIAAGLIVDWISPGAMEARRQVRRWRASHWRP